MPDVEQTNNKTLKIVVIGSAVIVLTIIVLAILGLFNMDRRTDEEKLVDAAIKTAVEENKTISMLIEVDELEIEGLDGMEAQMMKRVIQDLDLEVTIEKDGTNNTTAMDFSLGLNGIAILEGQLYVNEAVVAVYVPTLYDKVVYAYVGQMDTLIGNMTGESFTLPIMNDSQKAVHEEAFETIRTQLLEREYEDIENMVVFLASDLSSYMTGQAINVTGGQIMH